MVKSYTHSTKERNPGRTVCCISIIQDHLIGNNYKYITNSAVWIKTCFREINKDVQSNIFKILNRMSL